MLKVLLNVIKYILLIIDFTIIAIAAIFYSYDFYRRCIGEKVVIDDVVYELSDFLCFHEKDRTCYSIDISLKKKNFCDSDKSYWLVFKIPKIYKIYKEENKLVVVVPKDMDTASLNLQLKDNFYERKVLSDITRDYYKDVKRLGINGVDLIIEYVEAD